MAGDAEVRTAAPPAQLLRFWGQAVNYSHFLSSHGVDLMHVHRAYHRQFLCQRVLRVTVPVVVTVHSVNLLVEPHPDWIGSMVRENYRWAECMIAVSSYVKNRIVEYGADPARITVITNGVDPHRFRPRPTGAARTELGLPRDAFLILFSGNLIPRKGVHVLLDAFARCAGRHPGTRLMVIGDGQEGDRLLAQAKEYGVAHLVEFVGRKPFSEMPTWYQACDVFTMPSLAEGLSMAILEAMACGKAVITTHPDLGEHDAVVDGRTGLLVEYGDAEQLAHALGKLMVEPELVRKMGESGRRMAEETFDWERIGGKTAGVYRRFLASVSRQAGEQGE
jgi:glycosyltransferase involved in cell wall biosynthesis